MKNNKKVYTEILIESGKDAPILYHDIVRWGTDAMKENVKKAMKIFAMKDIVFNYKWKKRFTSTFDNACYRIETDKFIIKITGGSVIISDKETGEQIQQLKGYNYLYLYCRELFS